VADWLDLTSLYCFVTAARLASFRSAARACHLSPSAFGERIRRLEETLEVNLFARTTRTVKLTPAGEHLLPRAQQALDAAEACFATADVLPHYSLTLGTRYELGMSWLAPELERLERLRAGRTLHLTFGDSEELLRAAKRGEIDAVVTSSRLAVTGLRYAPLHEETYKLVAAPALLEKNSFRHSRDAASHRLIDASEDLPLFRYLLDAGSAKSFWAFGDTRYLGTIAAIRQRVLDGGGVAVLPEYFVRKDIKRRKLRVVLPSHKIQSDWFRLVWRTQHPRETELEEMAEELRKRPLR
jgi:DNA-binding transcriptional LysR family regulator